MRSRLLAACAVGLGLGLPAAPEAAAESLVEALSQAYDNNPQLLAERALVRATDESVPQALSGWRTTVTATGSTGFQHSENTPASPPNAPGHSVTDPRTIDLNITQPVYTGGRTVALTAQAEESVRAERARSVATEGTVLFSVIQAYFDVLRDSAVVDLNVNNEQVLRRQLEATNDQFSVGAVTRTDVAQAEARLAAATATRQTAVGQREVSRANYARAVGHLPESLVQPTVRPQIPGNKDEALRLASTKNPNVIAAIFNENAARAAVAATRAQLLPSLNIVGDVNRSQDTNQRGRENTSESIIARITVPLYEAGNVYSQSRQAVETVGQRKSLTDDARQAAVQTATQAWETIQSARATIKSLQSTIRAGEIALEGVQQEAKVGSRTVLDVLNAEQELFSNRVSLVQAQHDLNVAEFNLSQQIGRLTAADLQLPVKLYDVDQHYKAVRNKWAGFGAQ